MEKEFENLCSGFCRQGTTAVFEEKHLEQRREDWRTENTLNRHGENPGKRTLASLEVSFKKGRSSDLI